MEVFKISVPNGIAVGTFDNTTHNVKKYHIQQQKISDDNSVSHSSTHDQKLWPQSLVSNFWTKVYIIALVYMAIIQK